MRDVEDSEVTYGGLVKVAAIVIAISGYTIAAYAWVSSIANDVAMQKQEHRIFQDSVNQQLSQLREQSEANQRTATDLTITLNKTNAILEQFMKKGQ